MIENITLTSFRNHPKKTLNFKKTTIIVGKNTAGKTNILEAVHFLTTGQSFRAEKDAAVITYDKDFARIEGVVKDEDEKLKLAIILATQNGRFSKKFTLNSLPKRRFDFVSNFTSVLFTPLDLEIISASPNIRRKYIDSIIKKIDRKFYLTEKEFEKALKFRNRMLQDIKREIKFYSANDFEYWDSLLIEQGQKITQARQNLVEKINNMPKDIFDFTLLYDKSKISRDRLEKYHDAERAVGQTLVGPTRDDFIFYFPGSIHEVKEYGSRGEQRLTVLQTKILEIELVKEASGQPPTLLLDDIFSELDEENIEKIYHLIESQQTIITTTHEEFIPENIRKKEDLEIIHL